MNRMTLKATLVSLVSAAIFSAFAGGIETPANKTRYYVGLGGSWNTIKIEEQARFQFPQAAATTFNLLDSTKVTQNKLAPMLQVGMWDFMTESWLFGLQANYKYLGHISQQNESLLQNASLIVNVVNGEILQEKVNNELVLLIYAGYHFSHSYLYLGIGPSWITVSQSYTVNALRSAVRSPLYISETKNAWGWAAQLGLNYYFQHTWFFSFNYTFVGIPRKTMLNNAAINNAGIFGPAVANGTGVSFFTTNFKAYIQEFMISVNKEFQV